MFKPLALAAMIATASPVLAFENYTGCIARLDDTMMVENQMRRFYSMHLTRLLNLTRDGRKEAAVPAREAVNAAQSHLRTDMAAYKDALADYCDTLR